MSDIWYLNFERWYVYHCTLYMLQYEFVLSMWINVQISRRTKGHKITQELWLKHQPLICLIHEVETQTIVGNKQEQICWITNGTSDDQHISLILLPWKVSCSLALSFRMAFLKAFGPVISADQSLKSLQRSNLTLWYRTKKGSKQSWNVFPNTWMLFAVLLLYILLSWTINHCPKASVSQG